MDLRVLYSAEKIQGAVRRIAEQISSDFSGRNVVLVCVLKGSFIFTADLARELEELAQAGTGVASCNIEFMSVSSYGDDTKPGDIKIELDMRRSIRGKIVILVEDIADTLQTLARLQEHLRTKEPAELCTAVLLTKPQNQQRGGVEMTYVGIVGNDVGFVVGYGMDNAGKLRGLPYIAEIETNEC